MNITATQFHRFSFGIRNFDTVSIFNNISLVYHNFVAPCDSATFVGDIWPGTGEDIDMQPAL
jgi:hypothetical protein